MNPASEVTSILSSSRSASESPTVFVIDNDRSAFDSIESLVRGAGWQSCLFSSAEQFLAASRPMVPTCLVLEVSLPDGSGLELQNLLADRRDLPVVFLTAVRDVSVTVQAMKAGAIEFLTKPCSDEVLLRALGEALHHSQQTLRQQAEERLLRNRYTSLSGREREVMALVVAGLLNKQIAGELGISEITVKVHRGKMMRKMFARSVPDLVCMALTLQLVPDGIGPTRRTAEPTEKSGWSPRFEHRSRQDATLGYPAATGGIA